MESASFNSQNPVSQSELKKPAKVGWHLPFFLVEGLLFAGIVVLGLIVHLIRGPLPGDIRLELAWQHLVLPSQPLTAFINYASDLNWPNPALIGVIGLVLGLLLLRRWGGAFVAAVVSGLGDGSSYLANQLVQRPRPSEGGITILQKIDTYYSFPSGHEVHVIAFFGFILYLTFQTKHRHWGLWLVRLPLIYMILFTGPSRILEGEHWPSDILGGILLGSFWLILGIHFYNWLHRFSKLRHRSPFSSVDETWRLDGK